MIMFFFFFRRHPDLLRNPRSRHGKLLPGAQKMLGLQVPTPQCSSTQLCSRSSMEKTCMGIFFHKGPYSGDNMHIYIFNLVYAILSNEYIIIIIIINMQKSGFCYCQKWKSVSFVSLVGDVLGILPRDSSPFFTTIGGNVFGHFFQPPIKQIEVWGMFNVNLKWKLLEIMITGWSRNYPWKTRSVWLIIFNNDTVNGQNSG